jgi:hypothetical protein
LKSLAAQAPRQRSEASAAPVAVSSCPTSQNILLAMSTAGMPSASAPDPTVGSVPRKRPRQDSQSEDEGEISEGAPCEITDAAALDDLDKLRSHGSRFNIQHRLIHVVEFLQWHQNDLTRNTKLVVPQNYYQRDSTQGWDKDKESKYLRAVMAGQAFTPFVVNAKRKDARLMDGGHRLNTIKRFYENKVGMQIGDSAYMYKQVSLYPLPLPLHLYANCIWRAIFESSSRWKKRCGRNGRIHTEETRRDLTVTGHCLYSYPKMTGSISTSSTCMCSSSRTYP